MSFRKSSFFHGLNVDDDTYSGSFEGEFTGSVSASIDGEFTGSVTGGLTGTVAVLSSPWERSTGSVAGVFNANDFTLGEIGPRFAALVDELLVFKQLPPGPTASVLPQTDDLQLYYDATQQGDTAIIAETQNNFNMHRQLSGSFTFRTGPPSVDLFAGIDARNPAVPTARLRLNNDGIQTMMILMKPENIGGGAYVIEYSNGNNILQGFVANHWEFFVGGSESTGDDPRTGTQIPATQSVWQTVCYTVDVDGAAKQNGYHNGLLSIGPLNKTFDMIQPAADLEIGQVNLSTDFTGSFGAYLQWTTVLTAAEIKQAHNFLRDIDAGYGLPEAL